MWLNSSKYEKTCWGSAFSELDICGVGAKRAYVGVLLEG